MLNIMRASFYRFSKTKDLMYALMTSLAIGLAMGFTVMIQGEDLIVDIEGSIDNWMFFSFYIIIVFITAYIGGDFKSKVIYYEMMSGHARWEVIIGRMIPCTILSMLILTVGLVSNFSFGLAMNGWLGTLGGVGGVIGRYFLIMFNTLPFVVMCVVIAFLAKSFVNGIALEWLMWMLLQAPLFLQEINTGIESRFLNQYFLVPHMRQIITMPLNVGSYILGIISCLLKCSAIIAIGVSLFQKNELNDKKS